MYGKYFHGKRRKFSVARDSHVRIAVLSLSVRDLAVPMRVTPAESWQTVADGILVEIEVAFNQHAVLLGHKAHTMDPEHEQMTPWKQQQMAANMYIKELRFSQCMRTQGSLKKKFCCCSASVHSFSGRHAVPI